MMTLWTLDPAPILRRHDTGLRADFRRRTSRRFGVRRVQTLTPLSDIMRQGEWFI